MPKACRSRQILKNHYLLAKIGFDTAENEPLKVCWHLPTTHPQGNKYRSGHTPLPHPYCNPATPGVRENSSEEGTVEPLSGEARTEASKTFLKMSALLLVSERN